MKAITISIGLFMCITLVFGQKTNTADDAHRKRLDLKNGISSRFDPKLYETFKSNLEKDGMTEDVLNAYPPFRNEVDTALIGHLITGEAIPDELLDFPLRVYGYEHSDYITLRTLTKDRILVLDFWAFWCKPCVESMDHWEKNHRLYGDSIRFVGVNLDYDAAGIKSIMRFGWKLPHLIGPGSRILNRYLIGRVSYGPSAWIKDGKLFGISRANKLEDSDVMDIVKGKVDAIPAHAALH